MKRLIVNADDFGLTAGINRAVLEAHKYGLVSSTTLMASGKAFDDAIAMSRSAPKLSVGCHVVLTDGVPLLEASNVSTLEEAGSPLRFRRSLRKFVAATLSGRIDPAQVEAEANAQISKLQDAGVMVSHFDTHKHTHLLPQILRPLLRAAKARGVPAVRNPFGPVRFAAIATRPSLWKRYGQIRVLSGLARKFRAAAQASGLKTPDGTLGVVGTGFLDLELFKSILQDIPDGTWEFVCHPGYNDADLQRVQTRLKDSRQKELQILTSPAGRDLLIANNIELISYHDFAASKP